MTTTVTHVEDIAERLIIPPGCYDGVWTGYHVVVNNKWRLTTLSGIRGLHVPCKVHVFIDGSIEVDTEE